MTVVSIPRGTSREIDIPVRDEDGNPFDLANGKAVFWVGTSSCKTEGQIIIELAPSITVSGSGADALYTVNVVLGVTDTDQPVRYSYYYECRVWDESDNEYVIAADRFEITPSITVDAAKP